MLVSVDVVTFYRFCEIDRHYVLKARLLDWIGARDIRGTLIIAPEGINGTLSGKRTELVELDKFSSFAGKRPVNALWCND